jgi:hypothetical protein
MDPAFAVLGALFRLAEVDRPLARRVHPGRLVLARGDSLGNLLPAVAQRERRTAELVEIRNALTRTFSGSTSRVVRAQPSMVGRGPGVSISLSG